DNGVVWRLPERDDAGSTRELVGRGAVGDSDEFGVVGEAVPIGRGQVLEVVVAADALELDGRELLFEGTAQLDVGDAMAGDSASRTAIVAHIEGDFGHFLRLGIEFAAEYDRGVGVHWHRQAIEAGLAIVRAGDVERAAIERANAI